MTISWECEWELEWKYENGSRAVGTGMYSHCSFSTYHNEILFSNIRELGEHNHYNFTLARPSPEHVIHNALMCTMTDQCATVVND